MCVYVGVGTAYWMIDPALAVHTLTVLADALSGRPDTQTVISLGGSPVADELIPILTRPNVEVRGFVDQQAALASADVFVSHNGLNSTHEAVYHLVPMISIPQFGDQHGMARTVTDLGLAIPLGTPFGGAAANAAPGPSFTDADVVRVLDEVATSFRAAAAAANGTGSGNSTSWHDGPRLCNEFWSCSGRQRPSSSMHGRDATRVAPTLRT